MMRRFVPTIFACALVVGVATAARAASPAYLDDPFGDQDFKDAPLILDVAHPTQGRGELGLMFVSSIIDKYNSHTGLMLDFNYHYFETLGFALSFGFTHGSLTNIVTDAEGIIGNKVGECIKDATKCGDINPSVPDYQEVTGMVELYPLVWSPLYGKINLVSELGITTQIYLMAGLGINGTRTVGAKVKGTPQQNTDYTLTNNGFMDGGLFGNLKVNGSVGLGLRLTFLDWLDLRGEVRGIFFGDEFAFDQTKKDGSGKPIPEGYLSMYWFTHVGLGFILF